MKWGKVIKKERAEEGEHRKGEQGRQDEKKEDK